ncbi:hypothetical protein [Neobacillus terrae]|uniref:hypothetical protein n=1 Tax=Neobacillus terrae TaxID=3034837 RepID=UPI001408C456|nr:hypothetical protein [Neobacillus terrae]NHM33833.1 hypothetical protein [Neobacillus terrae]
MEDHLRKLKGELADWKFTNEMKQNVLIQIQKRKKEPLFNKKIVPPLLSATLMILFVGALYQYVIVPQTGFKSDSTIDEPAKNASQPNTSGQIQKKDIQKRIRSILNSDPGKTSVPSMNSLPNYTGCLIEFNKKYKSLFDPKLYDSDFKYKNLKTKLEFYQQFSGITTMEAIKQYSEPFLKETQDGLYIVFPPGGIIYNDTLPIYTTKIDQQKYEVKQYIKNKGSNTTSIITFEKINGNLLISGIERSIVKVK